MKKFNFKTIIYNLIIVITLIQFSSCEDILDLKPMDQYGEESVFSDLAMMEHFVNDIYWHIGHSFDRPMIGVFTDESMFDPGSDAGHGNVMKSLVTPTDYLVFDSWSRTQKMRWEHHYRQIRAANMFLDQVAERTYDNEQFRDRLTGEVYFLRAYHYHNLAFLYGGVPIIKKALGLADELLTPRDTFEELINFIVEDCNKAAELLPLQHTGGNFGRATKGAAMSLKARVLLYAASDLYNNTAWQGGYANPELVGYVGGDRNSRWQAAKNAAKAVIDVGEYSLHKAVPEPEDSVAQNRDELYLMKQTDEDIFIRNFTTSGQHWTYNIGIQNLPAGYKGWSNVSPINSMVDDYEMADGSEFDWSNPEHAANPYENREPRFYSDIFYDGAQWRDRPDDVIAMDPHGIIQTGNYEQADGTWEGGLDALDNPITAWNGTYTSYYLRKFQDITVDACRVRNTVPWRFIRYAEILLSYAEACIELGEYNEGRNYINMIRTRAGLPDIEASNNELQEGLRHERKIELMFEDHRFFDIRRWMIAPEVIVDAYGLEIRYHYGEEKPVYNIIHVQDREWRDRFYFFPIKRDEINRNELLIQNPLY